MNKEANEYLMNLVGREVPLKCVFTGIPSRDGVYLTTPTGESVNDKINQLLKPGWKDDNYDGSYYCELFLCNYIIVVYVIL